MGQWAEQGIEHGWLRQVSRKNVLEIKREAESHGMVTWMMNVESTKGQASCSCCGCCCHAMRMVNEFNAPGVIAPPHFLPRFDDARARPAANAPRLPDGGDPMDVPKRTRRHLAARCIGCGLCVVACGDRQAVAMEPVPDYNFPTRVGLPTMARAAPGMVKTAWHVWRRRP